MGRTDGDKRFKANLATKRPVRKKPKDKPKRPLSAYNYFFKEERQRILKYIGRRPDEIVTEAVVNPDEEGRLWTCTGKVSFEEMGKIIGGRWKAMDSETLKRYTALALGDAGRYKHELKAWNEKKELEKKNAVGGMYPYHPQSAPHYNTSPYPLTMPPTQAYHYNNSNPQPFAGNYAPPPHPGHPGPPGPPGTHAPPPSHAPLSHVLSSHATSSHAPPSHAPPSHPPPSHAPPSHVTNPPAPTATAPTTPSPYSPNPVSPSVSYPPPGSGPAPSPYAPAESRPPKIPLTAAAPAAKPAPSPSPPTNEYKSQPNDKGRYAPPTEYPSAQADPAPQPSSSPNAPPNYYPQGQYYGAYNQPYSKNPPAQQRWN